MPNYWWDFFLLDHVVVECDQEPMLVAVLDAREDVTKAIRKAEDMIAGLNDGRLDRWKLAETANFDDVD